MMPSVYLCEVALGHLLRVIVLACRRRRRAVACRYYSNVVLVPGEVASSSGRPSCYRLEQVDPSLYAGGIAHDVSQGMYAVQCDGLQH